MHMPLARHLRVVSRVGEAMTDAELRDQAVAELNAALSYYHKTTQGYIKNPNGSNWKAGDAAFGRGMALLAQIGQAPPPSPPPPEENPWRDFIGVCAYRESDLDRIRANGIRHVRWDRPSATLIENARAKGIEVLPIACYCPWGDLNGGRSDKYPPLPQFYAEWATRMVDTWRWMGVPPQALEVWNEPWLAQFWQPAPDAAAYLALVKAFAAEAWKVWPSMTILVSADTAGTAGYLFRDALLAADNQKFLSDPRIRPTTHNYVEGRTPTQVTSQPCYWDLDRFKCAYDAFKAHGHPDPQVWVTEFGWESDKVGEANQAAYVEAALNIFRDSGKVARSYGWMLKTNDSWSYNWLRPDNTDKPVVQTVKGMLT